MWQPIETAPKDGGTTYLILRCARPRHTCIGTFFAGKWKPIHSDEEVLPTHWMPLPAPPEDK